MKEKIKNFIVTALQCIFNPRFILCFGLGWMITNGWSYVMLGVGIFCNIPWMVAVSTVYLGILWFPFSPEKIITLSIAIALMKWLFPRDEKTLGKLRMLYEKAKAVVKKHKDKKIEEQERDSHEQ